MVNSNVRLSPEVDEFLKTLEHTKGIENITRIIETEVQRQLEAQIHEFGSAIANSNLAAIEVMREQLAQLNHDSATVKGVLQRLETALTPDLPKVGEDVTSFRQAIENLERYGSIIPTSHDIVLAQLKIQQNQAWSLFRQSLVKLFIRKLERFTK